MTGDIGPIVQHPTLDHRDDSTVAQAQARHLASPVLSATCNAIKGRIARIKAGTEPGTSTVIANLERALRALGGCDFGEFVPLYTVPQVTRTEWDRLREDLKDGDPDCGTARYSPKPGAEMVPCIVVADDTNDGE